MTCNEFETQIGDFVSGNLSYSILEKFLYHLHECKDCYDDLEIYYMTNVGLGKIEKDDTISYNFKGELEQIIGNYEHCLSRFFRFQLFTKTITIAANIVMLVVLLIAFLVWFDIIN